MLTDAKIRKLVTGPKAYKETDENGLYVEVRPTGKKFFRYRYRHPQTKKEQILTIGQYPAVGLAMARSLRDDARALIVQGIDPNQHKKDSKLNDQKIEIPVQCMSFNQLFSEWHSHTEKSISYNYSKDIRERIEKHLLPHIGNMAIDEIKPKDMVRALKSIEQAGILETMKRIKQYANRIFKYGIGYGYCETNPVANLPDDIFKKAEKGNFAHTTDPKVLAQILKSIDSYIGDISTAKALQLQPYVFLRAREIAGIKWREIDLETGMIEIPAERMKKKRPHLVPITNQVLSIIEFMRPLSSDCDFLFPSPRTKSRPISEQSLNPALHRLGFKGSQTFHGFRHTASTMLNEMGFMGDVIEKQLAHEQKGVRGVYNKAQYLPQRKEMMQAWGNYLDSLKNGGEIVFINKHSAH